MASQDTRLVWLRSGGQWHMTTNLLLLLSECVQDEAVGERLDPDEDVGLGHVADDSGNSSPIGNFLPTRKTEIKTSRGFKTVTTLGLGRLTHLAPIAQNMLSAKII